MIQPTLTKMAEETISYIESTPYQHLEILKAEDFEIHQVILEGHFVQPLKQDGYQQQSNMLKEENILNTPQGTPLLFKAPFEENFKLEIII